MHPITKSEAAVRQLNAAVRLLFVEEDSLVVHSLAVSAANVFSDLADKKSKGKSWREMMREDQGMSQAEIRNVLHRSWNFLKHADRDPEEKLELDPSESEYIMFIATLECGELQPTSTEMQVFQLWFLATGKTDLGEGNEIQNFSRILFPGLQALSRVQQLRKGAEVLQRQLAAERGDA